MQKVFFFIHNKLFLLSDSSFLKYTHLSIFLKGFFFLLYHSFPPVSVFCLIDTFSFMLLVPGDLWLPAYFKSEELNMSEFPLLLVKIFYLRFSLTSTNSA